MNKLVKIAAATALITASATASAWWGNPFTTVANELFGDIWGDFDMNMNINIHTSGRGYGWDSYRSGPYTYGPYAYGPYAYAPAEPADTAAGKKP